MAVKEFCKVHVEKCKLKNGRARGEARCAVIFQYSFFNVPLSLLGKPAATSVCLLTCLALLPLVSGCAAFRPMKGVPARYVPDEFRGASRSGKKTIDLSLLRQPPPAAHLIDTGDLLSVYVEGVLGRPGERPPVFMPTKEEVPPSVGYPLPVREDGTISLPLAGSVALRGLTIPQAEQRIREGFYLHKQYLNRDGGAIITVALQRPRTNRVLVIRQEASSDVSISQGGTLNIGALKRGTGKAVNLPVYKNDVLNALAEAGGLPGLDAENAIYVIRSQDRPRSPLGAWTLPQAEHAGHVPPTTKGQTSFVARGQTPGWSNPGAVDPQGDYRRSGSGWSRPNSGSDYRFAPPAMAPAPSQRLAPLPVPDPVSSFNSFPMNSGAPLPALAPSPDYAPQMPSPAPQFTPPPLPPPPITDVDPRRTRFGGPAPVGAPPLMPSTPPPGAGDFAFQNAPWPMAPGPGWTVGPDGVDIAGSLAGRRVIRIPVRLAPGEMTDIRPEDIILDDGDIVFIESRETEVFYTGGLLGGGQYTLPRDYDLNVLGAIAVAQGQRNGGGGGSQATSSIGGQSALNGDVSISASQVIVLRPLPDGTQVPIYVDLYQALRDPAEQLVIQPGDYILLQYTRLEAIGAFVERHILAGALFSVAAANLQSGK